VGAGGGRASVHATLDRRDALRAADYVVLTIQVGGLDVFARDIEIPARYGVSQCVGDTLGPGGVFRGLRHMAVLEEMARDMHDVCPGAFLLQYTNPMAMLCWLMSRLGVRGVGLCHSVQGTAALLAEFCRVPFDRLSYWVAGINHMAWFLRL